MPRTRCNFYLDPEQLQGLRLVRERDGVLPSEQIRHAIDLWLVRSGVKKRAERKRAVTRRRS
jgi:hypothetical protein